MINLADFKLKPLDAERIRKEYEPYRLMTYAERMASLERLRRFCAVQAEGMPRELRERKAAIGREELSLRAKRILAKTMGVKRRSPK